MRSAIAIVLVGCTGGSTYLEGERYATGDYAFHRDPDWLGGDTAASVDIGNGRTLWLFGDTFIATSPARHRSESTIVHNSIAVMSGLDLGLSPVEFSWQREPVPADQFPSGGIGWLTPLGGVQTPTGLILWFAPVIDYAPGGGLFTTGTRTLRIADTTGPLESWTPEIIDFAPDWLTGGCSAIVDDKVVAVSVDGDEGRLVRWPLAAVGSSPEWWTGTAWVAEAELVEAPRVVFPHATTQCSLVFDEQLYDNDGHYGVWLYAGQRGSSLDYRIARAIEGPYDDPRSAYKPSSPNGRVVSARLHQLVVDSWGSYAATWIDVGSTTALLDPATEDQLFWPHVARIEHYEAVE